MRPGAPGQLQLNPFKVRLMSMWLGKYGKPPRVAGLYPKMKTPGTGKMGAGLGGGMGMGMPKMGMMGGGLGGLK
jgi:hypothetical protein